VIKVLITDDHPVVRQGIRQILEDDSGQRFGLIDEAADAAGLLEKLLSEDYNVILLDISLPGRSGLDVIPDILKRSPGSKILIISIYPEEQYAIRALKLGASGYLTKSSAPEELISAVIKVSNGERFITSLLAEKIAFNMLNGRGNSQHTDLSAREMEVIKLLANGHTLNNIADILSLSPKTISTYRERILAKLNLKTTAEIIRYAVDHDLT
jgi:DNA-binding NarL/FixJ family response regulator